MSLRLFGTDFAAKLGGLGLGSEMAIFLIELFRKMGVFDHQVPPQFFSKQIPPTLAIPPTIYKAPEPEFPKTAVHGDCWGNCQRNSERWGGVPGKLLRRMPLPFWPSPSAAQVLGIFVVYMLADFVGFSWRIFQGTFPHKYEEKQSGDKIR